MKVLNLVSVLSILVSSSAALADPASVVAEFDRVTKIRGSMGPENLIKFVDANPNVSEEKPLQCELADITGKCDATPGDCFQTDEIKLTALTKGSSKYLVLPTLQVDGSLMGMSKTFRFSSYGRAYKSELRYIHNEERTQIIATQSLNLFSDGTSLVGEYSILVMDGAPQQDPELFDWVRKAPFAMGDFGRRIAVFHCK